MDADFPTTAWSCLEKVRDRGDPQHEAARNRFASLYWRPVFYWLRARGLRFADAEDLTQEFFLYLADHQVVDKADPKRGRFRDYLRGVLRRFFANQGSDRVRVRDRFERGFFSLEALMGPEERGFEPAKGDDPESIFDRQWAVGLWQQVVRQLRELYAAEDKAMWWGLFIAYHASAGKRPSQEALAEQFGLSRDQVRAILKKVQARGKRLLQAELREEGLSEEDIAGELEKSLRWLEECGLRLAFAGFPANAKRKRVSTSLE